VSATKSFIRSSRDPARRYLRRAANGLPFLLLSVVALSVSPTVADVERVMNSAQAQGASGGGQGVGSGDGRGPGGGGLGRGPSGFGHAAGSPGQATSAAARDSDATGLSRARSVLGTTPADQNAIDAVTRNEAHGLDGSARDGERGRGFGATVSRAAQATRSNLSRLFRGRGNAGE